MVSFEVQKRGCHGFLLGVCGFGLEYERRTCSSEENVATSHMRRR